MATLALGGCSLPSGTEPTSGGSEASTERTPLEAAAVDLSGEWTQVNGQSADTYQRATITADEIVVYWIMESEATEALYWAGTVEVPQDGSQSFSWESQNDTTKTETALLASDSPTKEFTYENGELLYEVTALGVTTLVTLAPVE